MSTQLARVVAPSGFLGGTRVVGGASDGSIAARVVVVVARCCRGFTAIRVAHIIIIVVVVVGRETRSGGCAVVPSDVRIHVCGRPWSRLVDRPPHKGVVVRRCGHRDGVCFVCRRRRRRARRGFFFVARAQCATRVVRARAGSKAEARET